jgi:hypothetical protein
MRLHQTTLKVIPLCASALLLGACATRITERETIREQPVLSEAPIVVAAPAPSGYTWVPGRYVRRADRWEWVPGRWVTGAASDWESQNGPKGSGSTGIAPIGVPAAEY